MKKIRINKDISIRWAILTNGEAVPLDGRDLKLQLITPLDTAVNMEFDVEGTNIVTTIFRGTQQKYLGVYNLTLWENYGKQGQSVVDTCSAFELVAKTCEEGFTTEECVMQSNLEILTSGGIMIPDAPADGKTYGRNNGEWVEIEGVGEEFVTDEELTQTLQDYAKKTDIPNVSGLLSKTEAAQTYQSKGNYATTEQLASKADKTAIPTKVSQLQNDSNYLTAVPDEYVTDTELQEKGYATTTQVGEAVSDKLTKTQADGYYQPKGNYALKSDIPDTSQLATKTELGKKLDATTYNSEKANFATKDEIGDIETILDNIIGG